MVGAMACMARKSLALGCLGLRVSHPGAREAGLMSAGVLQAGLLRPLAKRAVPHSPKATVFQAGGDRRSKLVAPAVPSEWRPQWQPSRSHLHLHIADGSSVGGRTPCTYEYHDKQTRLGRSSAMHRRTPAAGTLKPPTAIPAPGTSQPPPGAPKPQTGIAQGFADGVPVELVPDFLRRAMAAARAAAPAALEEIAASRQLTAAAERALAEALRGAARAQLEEAGAPAGA
jgi:hypothetical protein